MLSREPDAFLVQGSPPISRRDEPLLVKS